MAWEQFQPCPPGPVKDYKNDPRYKNEASFMGKNSFTHLNPWSTCKLNSLLAKVTQVK